MVGEVACGGAPKCLAKLVENIHDGIFGVI
jgi:hypothetical protein